MKADSGMKELCGAQKRGGGTCRQPAGHGTDHAYGPCAKHGGNLPAHKTAAARHEVGREAVRLGASADMTAPDLMMVCVRQAAGTLMHATQELANHDGPLEEDGKPLYVVIRHEAALERAARISKMALDAKLAERAVEIAMRWGSMTSAAFEAALADSDMPARERQAIVRKFETRLLALEQRGEEPPVIEGTAA